MATSIFYPPLDNALQKTLGGDLNSGVTASLTLNNANRVQNKPGVIVVDRIDTNGDLKESSDREYIIYTRVSGSTLTGLTRGDGGSTDQDHATGAVVEFVPGISIFQAIAEALATVVSTTDVSALATAIVSLTGTQTLTNKTLTSPKINEDVALTATATQLNNLIASVTTTTSSATPTPTGSFKNNELYITALAADAEFAAPSGTAVNGNKLIIRVKDNGTARELTYNAIYDGFSDDLPSTTTISKTLYMGFIYDSAATKWNMVATTEEA